METNITRRFPRPMGLTAMAVEYQKDPNEDTKSKMYNYLINQWFMGSGLLCGVSYDINTLASTFNIAPSYIKEFMKEGIVNSRIWEVEKQQDIINGLLGEQLSWAIEDRMEIVQQANLLKASQNGKYTPFISAEVNKALKLRLESSSSLQNIIRSMVGGNVTNIFTQINNQNAGDEVANTVTLEEARQLIMEVQEAQPKDEAVKVLEANYDISSLPVVIATDQEGVDTSKEGLNLNKLELNSITDNYKGTLEIASKEHHEIRREIEANIDQNEEDPELDLYEEDYEEETPLISESGNFVNSPYLNR